MEVCKENKEDSFTLDQVSENIQESRRSSKPSINKQVEKTYIL